jgi:hypothetical protein
MKILTFHSEQHGAGRFGAAYYLESAYSPEAVRIHAEVAPNSDAEFEILKDGVSIMNNRDFIRRDSYGRITSNTTSTTVVLTKGETSAESADDFINQTLDAESWITCKLVDHGGGRNFTIQLELSEVEEDE